MGKKLDIIKKAIAESSGKMKITHTGSSEWHEKEEDGVPYHYQSGSLFTHYKVEHPNGEVQHVSIDHDEGEIIKHKKDPNRPNGAIRGSENTNSAKWDAEEHENHKDMIRNRISAKTKVRMHK